MTSPDRKEKMNSDSSLKRLHDIAHTEAEEILNNALAELECCLFTDRNWQDIPSSIVRVMRRVRKARRELTIYNYEEGKK